MQKLSDILKSSSKKKVQEQASSRKRISIGDVSFVTGIHRGKIYAIPETSADFDNFGSNQEAVTQELIDSLSAMTGISLIPSRKYQGAGMQFEIDPDWYEEIIIKKAH